MNSREIIIIGLMLVLASCSNAKNRLNLTKRAPDEFSVISNPPLHIPPNFDLNNPNKPAQTTHEADVSKLTMSEKKFLQSLGASTSNVEYESDVEEDNKQGSIRKFFSKMKGKPANLVVDHVKEKERIEENKLKGKPINTGEIATKKVGGASTIDRILGNAE